MAGAVRSAGHDATTLSRAEAALRRIVSDLRELRCPFALIGGFAGSARTEPRLTRDADFAVLVTDDRDAETLARDLQARGWRVITAIETAIEQEAARRLATVRLAFGGEELEGPVVDLRFASSGIEPEIVRAAEPIELVRGLDIPVVRLGHLIALKVLSRDDRRGARVPRAHHATRVSQRTRPARRASTRH